MTWYVHLRGGAISEVTADRVERVVDQIVGGEIVQFWDGSRLVVSYPASEVVQVSTKQPSAVSNISIADKMLKWWDSGAVKQIRLSFRKAKK